MRTKVYVVEGRNDTTRLKQVFPGINVLSVGGSAINSDILKLLHELKIDHEIIVVTDPDYPGKKIRTTIEKEIGDVSHIYVSRDLARNKNNTKIGIEHMSEFDLKEAFKYEHKNVNKKSDLTMNALFELKLVGNFDSNKLRSKLSNKLNLGHVNGKALLERLKMLGINKEALIKEMSSL